MEPEDHWKLQMNGNRKFVNLNPKDQQTKKEVEELKELMKLIPRFLVAFNAPLET